MDGGAWWATVHRLQRVRHDWATSLSLNELEISFYFIFPSQSPVECLQASKKKTTLKYCNVLMQMCISILKVKGRVFQSCLTLCHPMDYRVHGILQARILEWIVFPLSRGSSQQRDQIQDSPMQADSLPAEPPEKPKNTGVCSLFLLQRIFPTQKMNPGLLHCRRILYQLSYQGIHLIPRLHRRPTIKYDI